jgi:CheY-like chemotaxis protein
VLTLFHFALKTGGNMFLGSRGIRHNPGLNGIRLIALSGYGQDADVQAALDAGVDPHLTKAPDLERLEQVLAGDTSCRPSGLPTGRPERSALRQP